MRVPIFSIAYPIVLAISIAIDFSGLPVMFAQDQNVATEWRKPMAIELGDMIAFVAPAAPIEMAPVLEYAKQLETAGYKVLIPENIQRKAGYLAGTDEERAMELNAMFRDTRVRAIFPCRGGYGLTRILDKIDYAAIRKDPKVITGFSDLTALHLAIAREARIVTFHSPLVMTDLWRGSQGEFDFATKSFQRALFADQYKKGNTGYTVPVPDDAKPIKLVGGIARGRLLGGNLSLLCSTLGTPYAIEPKGAILFLEDVNEAPYRMDRLLSQLRQAGVLDAVAGVVLGHFTTKNPKDDKEIDRVLRDYFGAKTVPVLMNFPVGHISSNATLPHGGMVELDADNTILRLLENPVQVGGM
jgi:muramoyltetrapeptide carboxypeptidase